MKQAAIYAFGLVIFQACYVREIVNTSCSNMCSPGPHRYNTISQYSAINNRQLSLWQIHRVEVCMCVWNLRNGV